jgi:protein-S-isoprenylcysteine O-methyltransferase Ste14
MPSYAYLILAAGWLAWMMPFFLFKRHAPPPKKVDRRARWGVLLAGLAYALLWQSKFWERSLPEWRAALSILLMVSASVLSWTARRALGRQWRVEAGLNEDHELVTSGPYRVVRHPIYTSMLCMLLGTGFIFTPVALLALSVVVFMAGTEIRVRIEDRLLLSRFGDRFRDYQRSVAPYIPFLK